MSESKTSKRMLEAIEQQMKALELRKAGKSFPAIAAALGYKGPAGAYRAVMSAIKRTMQEPADEVRKMELERLDALWEKTWKWAIELDEPKAVDRALKLMERRAKYLGLDAPVTVNHNFIKARAQEVADRLGVPVSDVLSQAAQVLQDALAGSDL